MARVLDTLDTNEALRLADMRPGRGPTPRAAVVAALPPTIRIVAPSNKYATADENLDLTYEARTRKSDPVTGVEVWVNGGKVNDEDQILSATDEGHAGMIKVKLPPQRCDGIIESLQQKRIKRTSPAKDHLAGSRRGCEA